MNRQWYYAQDGTRTGPLPEDEVLALLSSGTLAPQTLLWTEGMEAWLPAEELIQPADAAEASNEPPQATPPNLDAEAPPAIPPPPDALAAPSDNTMPAEGAKEGNWRPGETVPHTGTYKCIYCGPDGMGASVLRIAMKALGAPYRPPAAWQREPPRRFLTAGEKFPSCPNCKSDPLTGAMDPTGWDLIPEKQARAHTSPPPMKYFECSRPSGDGTCSDDGCPCGYPGANIPRGTGYFFISKELVEMRRDALSIEEIQRKILAMQRGLGATMLTASSGVFMPILMCEQGAKRRGIDLEVAAADARHWWETGLAPLRPTPMAKGLFASPRALVTDARAVLYRDADLTIASGPLPPGTLVELPGRGAEKGIPVVLPGGATGFVQRETTLLVMNDAFLKQDEAVVHAQCSATSPVVTRIRRGDMLYVGNLVEGMDGNWVRVCDVHGNEGFVAGDVNIYSISRLRDIIKEDIDKGLTGEGIFQELLDRDISHAAVQNLFNEVREACAAKLKALLTTVLPGETNSEIVDASGVLVLTREHLIVQDGQDQPPVAHALSDMTTLNYFDQPGAGPFEFTCNGRKFGFNTPPRFRRNLIRLYHQVEPRYPGGGLCWFCGREPGAPRSRLLYPFHKSIERQSATSVVVAGYRTRTNTVVRYLSGSVEVPRCSHCRKIHRRIGWLAACGGIGIVVVPLILLMAAVIITDGANKFFPATGLIGLAIGVTAAAIFAIAVLPKRILKRKRVLSLYHFQLFEPYLKYIEEGWQPGRGPSLSEMDSGVTADGRKIGS